MIRTVTLNPAVDRTATVERFAVGAVNRVAEARLDAGGKGVNVSKAVAALGGASVAYALLAGEAGRFVEDYLARLGVKLRAVRFEGETRTNLKIVDPVLGTHTDLNEKGPPVPGEALARLEALLFADLVPGDVLVLSGSVGNGVDPGSYAAWTARARALGALVLLDADGEALARGVAARPSLAKPNLEELERLEGTRFRSGPSDAPDAAAVARAARRLVESGVGAVVVSLGADGAVFVAPGLALRARGIPIEAASTVGAGDSLVAALALGLSRGLALGELVAPAVAAGTAAAAASGSSPLDPVLAASFEARVIVEPLEETP